MAKRARPNNGPFQLLEDVVPERPRLLLVGINPGGRSGTVGHHFAGNGNPFWRLLHASGLTPVLLPYEEDQRLAEIEAGRAILAGKIARWRPAVVAFVGVTLYGLYFGKQASKPGPGAKPETISGARVFVVPNPSGLNASFPGFSHKLVWFKRLRRFVETG